MSTGIFSAYLELNGTRGIDLVLAEAPPISAGAPVSASVQGDESREAAVASSRWATVF